MERRRSAGPVADRDEVRAVGLGDGQQRIAVEDAEPGRLVGQSGEALQLRHRDAAEVEGPLGPLGEADDDEPEAVLAGLVVLLDEAALLERREQPRRRRLVEPEPAGELGDTGLALGSPSASSRAAARSTERTAFPSRTIALPLSRPPGAAIAALSAPAGRRRGPSSRAAWSDSSKIGTIRSTLSPVAWASHMNHGSRQSGSGIAPRACIPIATASYSSWSEFAQSRYSLAPAR